MLSFVLTPLSFSNNGWATTLYARNWWGSPDSCRGSIWFKPCLWQISVVVRAVLAGEDVITVAPTGSGKSLTYWIPLLYIKHGITIVVSPLKLLGTQFAQMLESNWISAISITAAANATNELFEVMFKFLIIFLVSLLIQKDRNSYVARSCFAKQAQAVTASYASRWGKEKDLKFRSTNTNKINRYKQIR